MHTYVKTLQKVADRYAPSRVLSFDMVHVFKTLAAEFKRMDMLAETNYVRTWD